MSLDSRYKEILTFSREEYFSCPLPLYCIYFPYRFFLPVKSTVNQKLLSFLYKFYMITELYIYMLIYMHRHSYV